MIYPTPEGINTLDQLREFLHRSIGQRFRWQAVHMKRLSDERFAKLHPPRQEQLFSPEAQ